MDVIVHSPKNGFGHRFWLIAPTLCVTVNFLNPLQIDDRDHPDEQGDMLGDIDIQVGGTVAFEPDVDDVMGPLKAGMAFTLGAMGSAKTNFYNDAYKRGGWEASAKEVQRLWVAGRRDEAIAKVPEEMVLQSNLVGDKEAIRERLSAYKTAGVSTLRVQPAGKDLSARLETLGGTLDLIRDLD